MFLMSGQCLHGGSSYSVSNARLHIIEFLPDNLPNRNNEELQDTNVVAVRFRCPMDACPHNSDSVGFVKENDLYNHWRTVHQTVVRMS
jgi:hypothetical protein